MNELYLIIAFTVILALGALLGFFISNLRSKGTQAALLERNSQVLLQFENYKAQIQQQISDLKEQAQEAKMAAEKQFSEACAERESIRATPRLAPLLSPSTYGPARGFRNMVCISNPLTAKPDPARMLVKVLGRRYSMIM